MAFLAKKNPSAEPEALSETTGYVAAQLRLLTDAADAMLAPVRAIERRIDGMSDRIDDIDRRHADHVRRSIDSGHRPDQAVVGQFAADRASAVAERNRLESVIQKGREAWNGEGNALESVRRFIREHRGRLIVPTTAPIPAIGPEGPRPALDRIRAEITAIGERLIEVEFAPATAAELRGAALAALDRIAAQGKPRLIATARGGDDPFALDRLLGSTPISGFVGPDGRPAPTIGDGGSAFLVWLNRDVIAGKLGEIIAEAELRDALTDAVRRVEMTRLGVERLRLERIEEALVRLCGEAGISVPRRSDASPLAMLQIAFADQREGQ